MIAAGTRPAAGDADDAPSNVFVKAGEAPGKRAGIAMELVPGNGKGFIGEGHRTAPAGVKRRTASDQETQASVKHKSRSLKLRERKMPEAVAGRRN